MEKVYPIGNIPGIIIVTWLHFFASSTVIIQNQKMTPVEGEQAERRSADHVARYPLAERVTEERGIARGSLAILM